MGTRSNRVFHGDSKSGASAMVRRTESPLLKNGIFHASWKARTLRKNGGVIGGTTALTAGGSSKWNKRSSRFAAQWHVHRSPCILANRAGDLRLPLCKRPDSPLYPGKIPMLFCSRRSRRSSKRTRSLAKPLLLQHWKEKTMQQNSQLHRFGRRAAGS